MLAISSSLFALTTVSLHIGAVRFVLETLVKYGAPERILVEGAPHLGTDNLVRNERGFESNGWRNPFWN